MCQVEIVFIRKMGAGMGPARRGRGFMLERRLCVGDIEAATGGKEQRCRCRGRSLQAEETSTAKAFEDSDRVFKTARRLMWPE